MAKNSTSEALARIDEKMQAVHEYIVNEIRPSLKEMTAMRETLKWVKMGVIGFYGAVGSKIVFDLMVYLLRK